MRVLGLPQPPWCLSSLVLLVMVEVGTCADVEVAVEGARRSRLNKVGRVGGSGEIFVFLCESDV